MELPNGFTPTQIAGCITSKRLELTILPTEKCNFRCTYCYEDFAIGRMPKAVVNGIKNLITTRAPELEELTLSWFGGEPLLALSVITDISKHALELSQKFGFRLTGGLTTNGYLLSESVLNELVDLNQDFYQVSLDGWGAQHDVTRKRADGAGTFQKIWENLLEAKKSTRNFEMLLRIHLTDSNFESLKILCTEIFKAFGDDSRYRLDFQDVRDLGGEGGKSVNPIGPKEFKLKVAELLSIANPPVTNTVDGVVVESVQPVTKIDFDIDQLDTKTGESAAGRRGYEIKQGLPYICYASKPNHFLIRADGRVGKCTVALDHVKNTIGSISEDGTLQIDQAIARKWYSGLQTFDINQLGCPLPFVTNEAEEDEKPGAASKRIPATVDA